MTNKHTIAHKFILHEALVRTIAVLTQFCSGLRTSLNFLKILRQILDTFRPLIVYEKVQMYLASSSRLSFPTVMSARREAVGSVLRKYLGDSSELAE